MKKQKSKYPIHPEMMKRCMDRSKKFDPIIDILLVLNSKITLRAYYGSYFTAGLILIKEHINHTLHGMHWALVYKISDIIGWTKRLKTQLKTGEFIDVRHSKDCNGTCDFDLGCINESIPNWYKKITRIDKYE